jgi:hypothetical protein
MYRPASQSPKVPEPAHLAQVLLQLHATGAPKGLLGYWSRCSLTVFEVQPSPSFVAAAAAFLAEVVNVFVHVPQEDAHRLPTCRVQDMSKEQQALWRQMMRGLNFEMSRVRSKPVFGGF